MRQKLNNRIYLQTIVLHLGAVEKDGPGKPQLVPVTLEHERDVLEDQKTHWRRVDLLNHNLSLLPWSMSEMSWGTRKPTGEGWPC
jgi:hypothetical protein